MNYFLPQTWLHPQIEEVCRHVLSPAFDLDYKGVHKFKHATKDFWEHNFQFVSRDASRRAQLDVCVPSTASVALNLLLPEKGGGLLQALYFNIDQNRFQMGTHKNDPTLADFDLRRFARGLYFLGRPLEQLGVFGISRHEEVEWMRPRQGGVAFAARTSPRRDGVARAVCRVHSDHSLAPNSLLEPVILLSRVDLTVARINNPVDIFISHSSADAKVAKALIDLLRNAFNIQPANIRCTSVPGYKLEAGAHTETQLRQEIQQARVFIGLLSEISLDSAYVLFELGARWGMMQSNYYGGMSGMKNKIFPLLAAGASGSIIRDPLKAYNALSCEKAADLHQLVAEIGKELGQTPGSAAAYQDKLETVIRTSRLLKGQRTKAANAKATKKEPAAKTAPASEKKEPAKRSRTPHPKK